MTSSKYINKHQLRSASNVQAAIKKLLEYHIISRSQDTFYVDDELMQLWLK